jgi:hypothetical protein
MPEPISEDAAAMVAMARAAMAEQEARISKGVIFASLQSVEASASGQRIPPDPAGDRPMLGRFETCPLDGVGNNRANPQWAAAMTIYPRVAAAAYTDGLAKEPDGPDPRYISNRIFNNTGVLLYSPRNVSDWAPVWGQFVDHTIVIRQGRRQTGGEGEISDLPYSNSDPLERFHNVLGAILMNRSIAAPDTGLTCPRDQVNQHSSYIAAQTVYGDDWVRLNWLREGPADGNPEHAGARLFLREGGHLPRRDARGNPERAPNMVYGAVNEPGTIAVAGDQRANENPGITATQTLFAREHNRIVDLLPETLAAEDRFQIARAVVIAEEQYITYNEFLPAVGVTLPAYRGYDPDQDAGATNEFATIGYRAHAMVRGTLNVAAEASRYDDETVEWLRQLDIKVTVVGEEARLEIPLGFSTFFQPDLVERVGVGPILRGIGSHPMKKNDELISDKLRSLLAPMGPDTQAVNDLSAVDIARGRDHGFPSYNKIREVYGLAAKTSFREITGEESEEFPADPLLTRGQEIDDPRSLDFVALFDIDGNPTTPAADNATHGVRRTPLAARLMAIYGDIDAVDPFVGMACEARLPGSELGELQAAIWRREFASLRDGDRFFYENNPALVFIRDTYGIDFRTTLGDVIARNTDIPREQLADNVFFAGSASTTAGAAADGAAGTGPAARRIWHCGVPEI